MGSVNTSVGSLIIIGLVSDVMLSQCEQICYLAHPLCLEGLGQRVIFIHAKILVKTCSRVAIWVEDQVDWVQDLIDNRADNDVDAMV